MSKSDEWKNYSIEELEKQKVHEEIKQLAKPFYLKPSFLSIISSSLFAAITIFVTILLSTNKKLEEIDKKELDLRTRELKIKEDSLNAQIAKQEHKIKNLENEFLDKELKLSERYKSKSKELDQTYFKRLKEIQTELNFIEKYMNRYASGYSKSFTYNNRSTKRILDRFIPENKLDFQIWLEGSIKMAIQKSNSKTLQQVNLKVALEEFKLKQ